MECLIKNCGEVAVAEIPSQPSFYCRTHFLREIAPKKSVVVVKIEFEFDEENANEGLDTPLTREQLIEYATRTFVEDISTMSLHNELHGAVRVTFKERE